MNIEKWLITFNEKNSPDRLSFRYEIAIKHDYYEVYIMKGNDEYLFEDYSDGILKGKKWARDAYGNTEVLAVNELHPEDFRIKHYYRAHTIYYESLTDLKWSGWFHNTVIRLRNIHRTSSRYLYNRKNLESRERHFLLQETVNLYFENEAREAVSTMNIMSRIYSDLWLRHPDGTALTRQIKFVLDSLEASGDLHKDADGNFTPHPRALATLEEHSKAEARDSRDNNNRIWTLAVSVLALSLSFVFSVLSLIISIFK